MSDIIKEYLTLLLLVSFSLGIGFRTIADTQGEQTSHQDESLQEHRSTDSDLFAGLSLRTIERLRMYGTPRGRAPSEWTKLEWQEKQRVLFDMYAPSAIEKLFIKEAVPKSPYRKPKENRRILVFYRCQYPHASIATANYAYGQMAESSGAFQASFTDDPNDFISENLNNYDAVLLNNTTDFDITIGERGRESILEFVRNGGGLIGIHAASDSCKNWPEGSRLLNGIFRCHPWLPVGTWAFQLDSSNHPLNEPFGRKGFWLRDEVYVYRDHSHVPSQSVHLISLDLSKPENHESAHLHEELRGLTAAKPHRPVAWIHKFEKGRVFYSNLGHNNTTYWHPLVLKHYLIGIQFALGDVEVDSSPTDQVIGFEVAPATNQ